LSVGASRSVTKEHTLPFKLKNYGLPAAEYVSSIEEASSITFKPIVHPFMENALPRFVAANIRRKYLFKCSKFAKNVIKIKI
jgi:hypothetical protein